jgi:hypothetical protein
LIVLWSFLAVGIGLSVLDLLVQLVRHLRWVHHWRRDSVRSHAVLMDKIDAVRRADGCR